MQTYSVRFDHNSRIGLRSALEKGNIMSALVIDKGWLSAAAGTFLLLNSVTGLRVRSCQPATGGFNAEALIAGNWITIANFVEEKSATERVSAVLKEMKHMFRYGA